MPSLPGEEVDEFDHDQRMRDPLPPLLPLPELLEDDDDDELEMIDGGDGDEDDAELAGTGPHSIQGNFASSNNIAHQHRSGDSSAAARSSPSLEDPTPSSFRGHSHHHASSPIPRLLPAVRRTSPPPPPLPPPPPPGEQTSEAGNSTALAIVAAGSAATTANDDAATATTTAPSSPTASTSGGDLSATAYVDRIGAYFGYNGTDGNVPKPAYDAMLQRVRTLEDALGTANREVRSNAKTIAEQQNTIHALQQQVAHHDEIMRRTAELEAQLMERERDLDIREQALETIARHQRRMQSRKASTGNGHGGEEPSPHHLDGPTHIFSGGHQHQQHQQRHHQQSIPQGPSSSSYSRTNNNDIDQRGGGAHGDSGSHHLLNPGGPLNRRRGSNDSLVRREEEAYAQWVSPSPNLASLSVRSGAGAHAQNGPGLEALLDNARRSGLLPRLQGGPTTTTTGQPGNRSHSSMM